MIYFLSYSKTKKKRFFLVFFFFFLVQLFYNHCHTRFDDKRPSNYELYCYVSTFFVFLFFIIIFYFATLIIFEHDEICDLFYKCLSENLNENEEDRRVAHFFSSRETLNFIFISTTYRLIHPKVCQKYIQYSQLSLGSNIFFGFKIVIYKY